MCVNGRGLVEWAGPYPLVGIWRGAKEVTGRVRNPDLAYRWGPKPTLSLLCHGGLPMRVLSLSWIPNDTAVISPSTRVVKPLCNSHIW